MMHTFRICVLMLCGLLLAACSTTRGGNPGDLPEHRPSDFTLGVVVFGSPDADSVAMRSARYIVEPDGTLRASFGEGSDGNTYPPITRRLDASTLDALWLRVRSMDFDGEAWRPVQAPEQHHAGLGPSRGYLLEVRSGVEFNAWSTGAGTGPMRDLVRELAEFAWIQD